MSTTEFPYLQPPRLFKGWKWLIVWEEFIPGTTVKIRVRKTFDLNRARFIADPVAREARAQEILLRLKADLEKAPALSPALHSTPIGEAMQVALNFKCQSDREHTRITYTSFTNIFCDWLLGRGWMEMSVGEFDRQKALSFMDYVLTQRLTRTGKRISNRTFNNYIINMRSLFYELKERHYLPENPFANMKPRKEEQKLRHAFDQHDSNVIAQYVYRHNRQVYLAIILVSHCGLRLSELRRLRARDFDFDRGLIVLSGAQTKNKERAYITIPRTVLPALKSYEIDKIAPQYLIFGEGMFPHEKTPCGRNTISDRFREMLREMQKHGKLRSCEGYTMYSWKDTGAIAMVKAGLDIMAIKEHLRHKSLATTQRYLQSLGVVNMEVRDFQGVIFLLPQELTAAA